MLGIRKIISIPIGKIADISYLRPHSKVSLSSLGSELTVADLQELSFMPEEADFSESWSHDTNGRYSTISISGQIRSDKESSRDYLLAHLGRNHIWLVELIDGVKYIVGSRQFRPTLTFSDTVIGISSNRFSFKITLKSTHGSFLAV